MKLFLKKMWRKKKEVVNGTLSEFVWRYKIAGFELHNMKWECKTWVTTLWLEPYRYKTRAVFMKLLPRFKPNKQTNPTAISNDHHKFVLVSFSTFSAFFHNLTAISVAASHINPKFQAKTHYARQIFALGFQSPCSRINACYIWCPPYVCILTLKSPN